MYGHKVARAILEYRGDSIELLAGDNLVGRGLDCRIRFNDPTMSRRHLRLHVDAEEVTVQDLGSTNGTKVNGQRIRNAASLDSGDLVQIGNRSFAIRIIDEQEAEAGMYDETISDWQAIDRMQREPAGPIHPSERARQSTSTLPSEQTCPRCRAQVSFAIETCPSCGHCWPPGRPMSVTVQIPVAAERRRDPRVPVELPLIYNSESLTCDATAADLSRRGVFVITELLDPIDTPCRITLLPDGGQAVALAGVVRRLVPLGSTEGTVVGMGIEFEEMTAAEEEALSGLTI